MTVAADTREAVRKRPFLLAGLRAGVVNYRAAANWLRDEGTIDTAAGEEAIATALRRFGEELGPYRTDTREVSVTMQSGVGLADPDDSDDPDTRALLDVGGTAIVPAGNATAIVATGGVDAGVLGYAIDRLLAADVEPLAAGVAGDGMTIVVERRDGPTAVRLIEDAADSTPVR